MVFKDLDDWKQYYTKHLGAALVNSRNVGSLSPVYGEYCVLPRRIPQFWYHSRIQVYKGAYAVVDPIGWYMFLVRIRNPFTEGFWFDIKLARTVDGGLVVLGIAGLADMLGKNNIPDVTLSWHPNPERVRIELTSLKNAYFLAYVFVDRCFFFW